MALRRSVMVFAGWTFSLALCVVLAGCGGGAPPAKPKEGPPPFSKAKFTTELNKTKGMAPDQAANLCARLASEAFDASERDAAKEAMAEALKRMEELTETEPPATLVDAWAGTAPMLFKVGKRDEARANLKKAAEAAGKVDKNESKAKALVRVGIAQNNLTMTAEAGVTVKQAEDLAAAETDVEAKLAILGYVANGYKSIGKGADADRIVKSMLELANGAAEVTDKAKQLATAGAAQAAIEKQDAALETFKQAREAADSVKDPFKKVFVLFDVGQKMWNAKIYKSGREALEASRSLAMTTESLKNKQNDFKVLYEDIGRMLK